MASGAWSPVTVGHSKRQSNRGERATRGPCLQKMGGTRGLNSNPTQGTNTVQTGWQDCKEASSVKAAGFPALFCGKISPKLNNG